MRPSKRRALAGAVLWLCAGCLWIMFEAASRVDLQEGVQAERLSSLAREVWAPAVASARLQGSSPRAALGEVRAPGLVALRVYDERGFQLYVRRAGGAESSSGGTRELSAPLYLAGHSDTRSTEWKRRRIGRIQLLYSSQGGLAGIRVLDRKGRLITEPVEAASGGGGAFRVLEAPLYMGPFRQTPRSVGLVRVAYSATEGFNSATVFGRNGRWMGAYSGGSDKARTMRIPVTAHGREDPLGMLEVDYALPQESSLTARSGLAWLVSGLLAVLLLGGIVGSAGAPAGPEASPNAGENDLARARRQRDRFSHALAFERMFRGQFLNALLGELRAFRTSLAGLADSPGALPVGKKLREKSDVLQSIIRDVEGVAGTEKLPEPPPADGAPAGVLLFALASEIRPQAEAQGVSLEVVGEGEEGLKVDRSVAWPALKSLVEDAMWGDGPRLVRLAFGRSEQQVEFRVEEESGACSIGPAFETASDLAYAAGGSVETQLTGRKLVRLLRLPVV